MLFLNERFIDSFKKHIYDYIHTLFLLLMSSVDFFVKKEMEQINL